MLSKKYNFTTDYREATEDISVGSSEAVTRTVEKGKANVGIGGVYVTPNKLSRVGVTRSHSLDCAAFTSLSSTALPRYRAIMGPFHWTVWMALVIIYLFGIFPLSFSEKHTLKHLIKNPEEIENMFWYVYGTFTNCFTFTGEKSWSRADKVATRLLIVFYWLFTIIVTACYTGSIIAFVTLPVYPAVVDTIDQLKGGRYQIGILDKGEWPKLFVNYSDPSTEKLLKNLDLVPDVKSGLRNASTTFFWNYAFMGSKAELDFILRTNMTMKNKRSILHVSEQCLVPFSVAIILPKKSVYGEILNRGIEHIIQSGLLNKIIFDVEWEMMRSSSGKLLAANSRPSTTKTLTYEDRALTLDDTQGMFLLLGAGCLIGAAALTSEWFGGCFKFFTKKATINS
ncbi:unnamed protein product [Phaedon cochleariae]|uniref:Ionotropic glutamate receptor C-terminal domain-containing protein n=1 Tax=Phaedon cochleariae TaxID=80249 RepID=A0A9P0DP95_PHACE|nr:unnamed protein product [Phaedon cochleariae]